MSFTNLLIISAVAFAAPLLVLVRGVPAVLYRGRLCTRRTIAAGLLQATSLPFIVAAVAIGQELGALSPATAAALIAAGLVSVLFFPAFALALLRSSAPSGQPQLTEGATS